MSVLTFIVCLAGSLLTKRKALSAAYDDAHGRRWHTIAVFSAGAVVSGVLAAVSTAVSGVAGGYGLAAFLLMLTTDCRHFRRSVGGRSLDVMPGRRAATSSR